MLDKDQYNQDEYNNYYKQETQGAEIKGYNDNESGFLKKVVLGLGVVILGIVGYFGFKLFNNSDSTTTREKIVIKEASTEDIEKNYDNKSIEDKVIETIKNNKEEIHEVVVNTEKIEKTIQEEVATQVQEKLDKNKKMSTEDISKIVNIVMSKMEKEKALNNTNDHELLSALENNDQDLIKTEPKKAKALPSHAVTHIQSVKTTEHLNNKVTFDSDNENKDLDKLSKEITKLLNMSGANSSKKESNTVNKQQESQSKTTTNYQNSIKKEISVRTNEMRIIIVKPGDTLNKIAKRAYGDGNSYQKIFDANPEISRADKIYVGQKLRIPN